MVTAQVNGETQTFVTETTIAQLLADRGLAGKPVAVEVNRGIVSRGAFSSHVIEEDDEIEIVTIVAGG